MKRIIAGLLLGFVAKPAMAAEVWQTESMLPAGLKMLGGLVFVLGLILLLYYLSRKGFGFLPVSKNGAIQVVEMRHLMPKKALCLVKVRGRELLLAIGTERIELLTPLEQEKTPTFDDNLRSSLRQEQ